MTYRVVLMPVDCPLPDRKAISSDGVVHESIIGGILTEAQARSLASTLSNNSIIAKTVITNTVQSSPAQQAALILYLAAIQAATNTGAVETAINAL